MITQRSAVALSIKSGGSISEVDIAGGVTTNGLAVTPIEMQGEIGTLLISGGAVANGGYETL